MITFASPIQLELMHTEILCSDPPSSPLMQESTLDLILEIKLFLLISSNSLLLCSLCTFVGRFQFTVMLNVIREKYSAEC